MIEGNLTKLSPKTFESQLTKANNYDSPAPNCYRRPN